MTTPSLSLTQFIVNTNPNGNQSAPRVAALSDGRSIITWAEGTAVGPDISGTALRAQIVRADGTFEGPELLVNTFTANVQDQADVTALENGGFVVTWRTSTPADGDGNGSAIKAQVFDSAGGTVGGEFLVNVLGSGSQSAPTITALADGGFAVAWQGAGVVGGPLEDLGLRIFNANGTPSSGEINWTEGGLTAARQPSVTQLGNGNLVVSYLSNDADTSGIRARIFTSAGAEVTGGFDVNTTTTSGQTQPDVVALTGGGFVVTWTDNSLLSADTSGAAVRAQVFTETGVKVGAEILVNTTTTGNQNDSSVTALSDGRFLVAWTDQGDGGGTDIRAQLFDADGTRSGSELLVSVTNTGNQAEPAVQELSDGRIQVSWNDEGDVVAQVIDPREAAIQYSGTGAADIAVGTRFNDTLTGNNGADRLFGAGRRDTLDGGAGNDALEGGNGADSLTGGRGADAFVFTATSDSTVDAAGRDLITDFRQSQGDILDLSAIDANASVEGNDVFTFIGADAFTALGQVRAYRAGGQTIIEVNTRGGTGADMQIVLDGLRTMTGSDFDL